MLMKDARVRHTPEFPTGDGTTMAMAERPTSYDYEALLTCGRGELFGRGNAQLPLPPMLMFDRIASISETGGAHGKGRALGEGEVKFTGIVIPTTKTVQYVVDLKRVILRKLKLAIADGVMKADGQIIYAASDLRVGLFEGGEQPAAA